MRDVEDDWVIERRSPLTFEQTIGRLSQFIVEAGMELFATIDHAKNARDVGQSMPASTVLIYGKAVGGTPIMLDTPQSALDLPLRVLVRSDLEHQTFICFHPIKTMLEATGVPMSLAATLEPAQQILLKAISDGVSPYP